LPCAAATTLACSPCFNPCRQPHRELINITCRAMRANRLTVVSAAGLAACGCVRMRNINAIGQAATRPDDWQSSVSGFSGTDGFETDDFEGLSSLVHPLCKARCEISDLYLVSKMQLETKASFICSECSVVTIQTTTSRCDCWFG
jgi:hypothetical protein